VCSRSSNPRVALTAFNVEGVRFPDKYRMLPRRGRTRTSPRGWGACGKRIHDFDGARRVLEAIARRRHHPQAQEWSTSRRSSSMKTDGAGEGAETACCGHETGPRRRRGGPPAGRRGRPARADAPAAALGAADLVKDARQMHATDDEIARSTSRGRSRVKQEEARTLECPLPRGKMMPVLGSGMQADVMLIKHSPMAAEIEEGVASTAGRQRADDLNRSKAGDRPAGRLRHALSQMAR